MISPVSITELAAALQAQIRWPNGEVDGDGDLTIDKLSIDTRTLQSGDLYIAISGERFDGHDFIAQAIEAGACAVVVDREVETSVPALQVKNTRVALGRVAAINRSQFKGRVAAVTGSAGKTTVKEMVASILSQSGAVLATAGNFNNDIGVPLTMMRLGAEHTYAVLELGASSIGEIAYTVDLAKPDVSILTNAADAHIEGFGSLSNIVQAKGEIIDGLGPEGTAVLNADDLNCYKWINRAGARPTLTFSLDLRSQANFVAKDMQQDAAGRYSFTMVCPQGEIDINLHHLGQHNVRNALAAAAAALTLGANLEQVKAGLETAAPVQGRLTPKAGLGKSHIIDDSYNASPEAVKAAIDVLAEHKGQTILVLGEMAELGSESIASHAECGRYAQQANIDVLLAVGGHTAHACMTFGPKANNFASKTELIEHLKPLLNADTTVLVKGSRSARMEEIVTAITAEESN